MIPRFIHSNMAGAPVSATTAGGHLSILYAALVTGFNIKTPSSVTVASGVATFTYLTAHGYEEASWLRVAGAGLTALNADHQISVPSTTTLTVSVPGAPDGAVSGSIETRVAPLGWERPFFDTNIDVYRSPNILGSRMFYQVNDANLGGNNYARLRGYEDMTGASAGTDPFPTLAQAAATSVEVTLGPKGTGTPWAIVGDDRTVYFFNGQSSGAHQVASFGDFDSFKPADAYAAFVGLADNSSGNPSYCGGAKNQYLCRDSTALVKSLAAGRLGVAPGESGRYRTYPGATTGGVSLSRPVLQLDGVSSSLSPVRGKMRGLTYVMEAVPAYPWVVIPAVDGVTGRVVILADRSGAGCIALPVDEAW